MRRKSTDLEYYRDKKLVIDADGFDVVLPVEPLDSAARAETAARSAESDAASARQDADRAERVTAGLGNTTTVQTEAEAKALTALPKKHKVFVVDTKNWYEEE